MFYCSLCASENKWVYTSTLCDECSSLKDLIKIYTIENILKIVQKVLIVDQFYPAKPVKIIRDEGDLIEKEPLPEEDFNKKVSDEIDIINKKYNMRVQKSKTKSV